MSGMENVILGGNILAITRMCKFAVFSFDIFSPKYGAFVLLLSFTSQDLGVVPEFTV